MLQTTGFDPAVYFETPKRRPSSSRRPSKPAIVPISQARSGSSPEFAA